MRNSQWYPHICAVNQHVGEARQRSGHGRTEPVIGLSPQFFGNVGRWGTCPATGKRVDPAIDAAVASPAGQESPEAVGEITNQVRSHGFDVPAGA